MHVSIAVHTHIHYVPFDASRDNIYVILHNIMNIHVVMLCACVIGVDKRVYIWDIESGNQVCELPGHTDTVYTLAFSRDSNILASG